MARPIQTDLNALDVAEHAGEVQRRQLPPRLTHVRLEREPLESSARARNRRAAFVFSIVIVTLAVAAAVAPAGLGVLALRSCGRNSRRCGRA
jgi:hypothetical protein